MSMNRNRVAGSLTFCTIVRYDLLGRVQILAESIRAHHPCASLFVLVLDPPGQARDDRFDVVKLEELGLPDLPQLRFLCTAAGLTRVTRPYLLTHLSTLHGARHLVSVDPELVLVGHLRSLERSLARHPLVVAPHLATPRSAEDALPDDPSFVALACGTEADAYLNWWRRAVNGTGQSEERQRWADRVWIDLVPGVVRRGGLSETEPRYGWGSFDNGVGISDLVRRCYLKLGTAAAAFGDPFATAGKSFYAYLTTPQGGTNLSLLLREIYDQRPDLHAQFPDVANRDRAAFLHWAATSGAREHGLDSVLVTAQPATPGTQPATQGRTILAGGPVTERFGINVMGYFQSEKGVGEHARSTVRALKGAGIPHVLNNCVDLGSSNVDLTCTDFTGQNPYPVNLIVLNADAGPSLAHDMPGYLKGRYNIGYWNWELERFPEEWRGAFQYFDEIWALSTFTRDSIARVSPIPVLTIPTAIVVPPARPSSISRQRLRVRPHAFLFLFAFDFHSHLARKNPLAVIEAFRRAFPSRRDVALVLKTSRSQAAPLEFSEVLLACQGQPNIHIVREVLSRTEMYDLLRLCDAYVGLHRSEGFGLPLAEAMALGKPVIATGYSANVDFMNESNSYPVRYRMVAIEEDHGPYRKGAEWADPDVEHAAEQLRRVVEEPEAARAVAERARADMARLFSPQAVGQQMRDRLNAIVRRGVALGDPRFVLNTESRAA